jgi:hypothetical protein
MKFKLLIFSFIAMVIASFSVGCGKSDSSANCFDVVATDTGAHSIFLGSGDLSSAGLEPIRDCLVVSKVNTDSIRIYSKVLDTTITGKIDPTDCNRIILDSLIITGNALSFATTSTVLGIDTVKISKVRAGGYGEITATGAKTYITIAKGTTNITTPINLTDLGNLLGGAKIGLRGTFLKIP